MPPTINSTRGMSFDPKIAAAERERKAEEAKAQAVAEHRRNMRQHGRMLDQIENCYRQHNPQQIRFAEEMEKSGPLFDSHIGDCRYL